MNPINLVKEIVVRIPDTKGALAQVLTPLAEARLNLRSLNLTGFAKDGLVRLYVEDAAKALEIMKRCNFMAWEQDVLAIEVSNEIGSAAHITTRLTQAGIDIRGLYATTGTGGNTTLYVWTSDDQAAMKTLK